MAGRRSARRRLRVVTNRRPDRLPVAKRDYSVMEKLVNDFLLDWVARRQVAESTRSYYVANLRRFLAFCRVQGITSPKLLTPDVADQYIGWLVEQPRKNGGTLSAHSAHKSQRAFKMFTKWLRKKGYVGEDPAADQEMIRFRSDQSTKYLSEDEVRRVLAIPKQNTTSGLRAYLIIYILASTGIRQGELLGLKRSDLMDKEHRLRVRAPVSKSRRDRVVFLPEVRTKNDYKLDPEFARGMAKYLLWRERMGLGPDDHLFVDNAGRPLSRDAVASQLKRIGQEAGVRLSARLFRHTCAVLLLKRTGDLDLVREVLRHSDFNVTKKYLRFTAQDVQDRYRQADIMDAVREERRPTMRDVGKAIRRSNMTEQDLADLIFEARVKEDLDPPRGSPRR